MAKISRALISVFDKTGVVEFARGLADLGVELISTGGTAKALREAGLTVKDISELTDFPEMMDGRVKTLHPKIHGGLLFRRDLESHVAQAREHGIAPIDLVAVNLYPFEQTIAKPNIQAEEAIEQIDIGGPSMVRSASKNFESVTVVVDPADYATVLKELQTNGGNTQHSTRLYLAGKVFATTARYDAAIGAYLKSLSEKGDSKAAEKEQAASPAFELHGVLKQTLRYGENPHQKNAALYVLPGYTEPCVAKGRQISGKEIGFNNYLDMDAAFEIVRGFQQPAACIVKHNNPCGVATDKDILVAYKKSYESDPLSAFGGVLALNRNLDLSIAEEILGAKGFKVDAIVVPSITDEAREALTTKKKWGANVIIIETGCAGADATGGAPLTALATDARVVTGGILVQTKDEIDAAIEFANLKVVTKREPTPEEIEAMKFAWIVCRHVKSNAIVLCKGTATVGIGAGQMSRVDSVEIAIKKAGERAKGAVLASDAFFPFPDGPEAAAKAGVTAMIQPGGSVKDEEVFALANKYNIAMVTVGRRHFRH